MGIIRTTDGWRRYTIELERHGDKKTELPVEKLDAVFLEGRGWDRDNLEYLLNHKHLWKGRPGLLPIKIKARKRIDIVKRAEKSGTEIWMGNLFPTNAEHIAGVGVPVARALAGLWAGKRATEAITRRKALGLIGGTLLGTYLSGLPSIHFLSRSGNAQNRSVSRVTTRLLGKTEPYIHNANVHATKIIHELAYLTGHRNIGVLFGSGHENLSKLLAKFGLEDEPTLEERRKIAARGPNALKMFRCVYDKEARRWRVEEHTL